VAVAVVAEAATVVVAGWTVRVSADATPLDARAAPTTPTAMMVRILLVMANMSWGLLLAELGCLSIINPYRVRV
jgi:hypothetical protein